MALKAEMDENCAFFCHFFVGSTHLDKKEPFMQYFSDSVLPKYFFTHLAIEKKPFGKPKWYEKPVPVHPAPTVK